MDGTHGPVESLLSLLRTRGETLSVAETTTGGLLSAAFVAVPGSSAAFDRGIVAYSKASKLDTLGMDPADLVRYGAVSEESASAMAAAVRRVSDTTWGIAETGIAGPIRGRSPKPLGTACLAVSGPAGEVTRTVLLEGGRQKIREGIVASVIEFFGETVGIDQG